MTVFTIIVPVWNVAPYLRECLDSIRAQTLKEWECVCVDDGSTDGSGAILDEYATVDSRFRVIHQENSGVSAARNLALEMAEGEYFLFVDGDDAIVPDSLECFRTAFDRTGADGLLCHPDEDFLGIDNWKEAESDFDILSESERPIDLLVGRFASHGYVVSRIYRRSVFGQMRFQTGVRVTEDVRFWADALCVKVCWAVVQKRYYAYRKREDSASVVPSWPLYKDCLESMVYVFRTMRGPMGATTGEIKRYAARFRNGHHLIFLWACKRFPSWSKHEKVDFITTVLAVCASAKPAFPFFQTDRLRLLGLRLGYSRTFDPVATFLDRVSNKLLNVLQAHNLLFRP